MKTVDAAIGKWDLIFDHFGLPPIDPRRHYPGECPVCSGKGKLRITDRNQMGDWVCICGAGTGMKLVELATGREFGDLAKEIDRIIGNVFESDEPPKPDKSMQFAERFRALPGLRGTDGQTYLLNRGITILPQGGVKWSAGAQCKELGLPVPGLYAIASDSMGRACAAHVTLIRDGQKLVATYQDGEETLSVPSRKMHTIRETQDAIAIKLQSVGESLGVAEGIETALSATQLYQVPCWATLNASLMRRFRPPPGVKKMIWFSDNDRHGKGLASAFHAGTCSLHAKNDCQEIIIRWPKKVNDFNDVLRYGDDVLEWRLTR